MDWRLRSVLGFPRVWVTRVRVRGFCYSVAVVVLLVVVVGSGGFWR
jgi:hypothetical protein